MRKIIVFWFVGLILISALFNPSLANSHNVKTGPHPSSRTGFGTDRQIGFDTTDYDQHLPALAVDNNGIIYTVWEDFRESNWDLFYSKSTDKGNNWLINQPVNDSLDQGTYQRQPAIAIDSNDHIYLVYEENRNGDWDIYFTKSTDGGDTWSTQVPVHEILDPGKTFQLHPSIAVDSQAHLYVVWTANTTTGRDIYISKSTDHGLTWTDQHRINDDDPGSMEPDAPSPSIAIDGNDNVYVVWEDNRQGTNDIYFSNSSDGGVSFGANVQVNDGRRDGNYANTKYPQVEVNSRGDIYLIWEEEWNSVYNVYFSKSLNHGASFDTDVRVNAVKDKCYPNPSPSIALDDRGNIYAAWVDSRDDNHTYFATSTNGGLTFSANSQVDDTDKTPVPKAPLVTYSQLEKARPELAVSNDNTEIYIVWADYRNDPLPANSISDNSDIYFDKTTTLPDRDPDSVTLGYGSVGSNFVELTWSMNQAPDFGGYLIYSSTLPDFEIMLSTFVTEVTERSTVAINITDLSPTTTYYYKIRVYDIHAKYNDSNELKVTTLPNSAPLIALVEPDGDNDYADTAYLICWIDNDSDDNATINLYYDLNAIEGDEFFIATVPQGEDSYDNTYLWNTTNVSNGQYFVKAVISDSVNPVYSTYSAGRVAIHHGETIPPEIVTTKPLNGTVNVGVTTEICVVFNEVIDITTLTNPNFYILDSRSDQVEGDLTFDNSSNMCIFTPLEPLKNNENYTATVTTGIRDLVGNALEADHSWVFTTESLYIEKAIMKGRIYDNTTGDIIPNARLTFTGVCDDNLSRSNGRLYYTSSDETGTYELEVLYGIYNISVRAQDYQTLAGCIINLSINLKSYNFHLTHPIITEFDWRDSDGDGTINVDEEIEFTSQAVDFENDNLLFVWNFGDGSTNERGETVKHKFTRPGSYEITLTVTDLKGGNATNTTIVKVEAKSEIFGYFGAILFIVIILIVVISIIVFYLRRAKAFKKRELEAFRMVEDQDEDEGEYEEIDELAEEEAEEEISDELEAPPVAPAPRKSRKKKTPKKKSKKKKGKKPKRDKRSKKEVKPRKVKRKKR